MDASFITETNFSSMATTFKGLSDPSLSALACHPAERGDERQ